MTEVIELRPRTPDDVGNRPTVKLPRQRRGRAPGRAPFAVAAAFATLWAALWSYLPIAVVLGIAGLLDDDGTVAGAIQLGGAGWLLAHGVPLSAGPVGAVGLVPLLLSALAAWRLARAGVHVTRAVGARHTGSVRLALLVAAAVGVGYGLLGVAAAVGVVAPGTRVEVWRAGLTLGAFAGVTALAGALHGTGALAAVARRVHPIVRHGARTGVVAAMLVLAAGAGVAGLSIALGGGHAGEMIGAYRTGVAGQAGITLVSLVYAPNAAVWAAAYLLGPGFILGTETIVRLTDVVLGQLPAVPLLAGVPEGPVGGIGVLLLLLPVAAGAAAGALAARRMGRRGRGEPVGWPILLGSALIAGPVGGLVLGLAAWASGGPLGSGRLAQIGPVPWQVALVASGVLAGGAVIGVTGHRLFARPR